MTCSDVLLLRGLPYIVNSTNRHYPVASWLFTTSALVAGMVHIGGMTRLTQSGLSMTNWTPLGSLPPLTMDQWKKEFEQYKKSPEWTQRQSMSLSAFQRIYYWEWGHRMMGRIIGLSFICPWLYFTIRHKIPKTYSNNMKLLLGMGGSQGLVGWWMVKSGIGEDRRGETREIRVSPYRLAMHFGVAVSTYTMLVWTALSITSLDQRKNVYKIAQSLSPIVLTQATLLRKGVLIVSSLTSITLLSGVFVSGNNAGHVCNTYPLINDTWFPPQEEWTDEHIVPCYRNYFETNARVHWYHRLLGTLTALSAVTVTGIGVFHPHNKFFITPQVKNGVKILGTVTLAQMSLGIATVVNSVPVGLAAIHQLGSLVVWTTGIYVVHGLRYVSPKVLQKVRTRT